MYEPSTIYLLQRFSVALAIGLLIGLERGWRTRGEAEGERAAGLRTHALAALLGGVWGAIAAPFGAAGVVAMAIAFSAVVFVIAAYRWRENIHEHSFGATTVVAVMLCFALGTLAVVGDEAAAGAAAVATAVLLAMKSILHAWVRRLTWPELRSVLILAVMTFILLPALPNRAIDRFGAINPFELWLMTVLIGVISFAGYVAAKAVGYRRGVAVAGAAGGLASSTAATAAMSRLASENMIEVDVLAAGAIFANAVMAPRLLAILGVVSFDFALRLAAPLLAFGLAYALAGFFLMRRTAGPPDGAQDHLTIRNPLDLPAVLKFGALLAIVMVLAKVVTHFAGSSGAYALALVSGLVDVDAISLSMARLGEAQIGPAAAAIAVLLALISNTVAKTIMGWVMG
ncbi:MAG: DUF4010 domain-containing protein, partial [Methylocystis sp.]|nr:DUF4010 domain-containing protein [Methylocystis sp.]